jgi:Rieske Fe-S protein
LSEKITAVTDLAPGEGRVVTIDGSDVALSKDSHGELHAVSPVCTHMKCHVTWNTTEQSWDCPCHGSRYSPDGKVITGPATHELELVELAKANGHVVHPNSEL